MSPQPGAPVSNPTPSARAHELARESLGESRFNANLLNLARPPASASELSDIWQLLGSRDDRYGHIQLAETLLAGLSHEGRLPPDALAFVSDPLQRYVLLVDALGMAQHRVMGEQALAALRRELRAMLAAGGRRLRASIDAALRACDSGNRCGDEPVASVALEDNASALELLRRALANHATDRTIELLGEWQAACGWRLRQALRAAQNELQWVQLAQTLRMLRELAVARSLIAAGANMQRRCRQLRVPLKRTRLQLAVMLLETIEMPPPAEQLREWVDSWLLDASFAGCVFAAWADTLRFEVGPERWPSDEDRAEFIAMLERLAYGESRFGG